MEVIEDEIYFAGEFRIFVNEIGMFVEKRSLATG